MYIRFLLALLILSPTPALAKRSYYELLKLNDDYSETLLCYVRKSRSHRLRYVKGPKKNRAATKKLIRKLNKLKTVPYDPRPEGLPVKRKQSHFLTNFIAYLIKKKQLLLRATASPWSRRKITRIKVFHKGKEVALMGLIYPRYYLRILRGKDKKIAKLLFADIQFINEQKSLSIPLKMSEKRRERLFKRYRGEIPLKYLERRIRRTSSRQFPPRLRMVLKSKEWETKPADASAKKHRFFKPFPYRSRDKKE